MATKKVSAGLLMYRRRAGGLEVFLAHPGGPFFARKDEGAWSIPKGEVEPGEELLATALREFEEETGIPPGQPLIPLGEIKQKGGKVVHAWAFEGDWPAGAVLRSNSFSLEWPAGSGRFQEYPEIDRAELFDLATARRKVNAAQAAFLDRLVEVLAARAAPD
jgi:predicted NUDIX family NTP pyrophosphohydrolase